MAELCDEEVDELLAQLLSTRDAPPQTFIQLPEEGIVGLLATAKTVLLEQPILLELNAPINIVGDVHGQYCDLLRLFEMGGFPGVERPYLFLGDYVDRGSQGIETFLLLVCYKIKFPENFFMLRGNHECPSINRIYGFYDECKRRYSVKLWRLMNDLMNCLPAAAIIDERMFCVHGGLSPDLATFDQILDIERPAQVPDEGLLCDFLWADPDPEVNGWEENARGVSYTFGADVVSDFLARHDFDLVVRAHQVVEDGYEFFADRQLVTIFSAPNYWCARCARRSRPPLAATTSLLALAHLRLTHLRPAACLCTNTTAAAPLALPAFRSGEFDNAGAIMLVDENLCCSFKILRPKS